MLDNAVNYFYVLIQWLQQPVTQLSQEVKETI
jgi:hypothetical protein